MADVHIHRCTLRVVRRRGWSWGADPRRLLRAATAALPSLLERKLAELLPDDEEIEIAAPVRLTVPLSLSELLALAQEPTSRAAATGGPEYERVAARLARAVELALPTKARSDEETRGGVEVPPPRDAGVGAEGEGVEAFEEGRGRLLRLLLAWRARGELEMHLATLDEVALEVWYKALLETPSAPAAQRLPAEAVKRFVSELAQRLRPRARDLASTLRLKIVAVVEAVECLQVPPADAALREALEEAFAPPEAQAEGSGAAVETDEAPHADARAESRPPTPAPARKPHAPARTRLAPAPRAESEVEVSSALPFLLLGPLARVGYWEALAGALEAADLAEEAELFAAALAYKVLAPPERGWRRTPDDERAAAAFAGLEAPPAGAALAEFARKAAGHLAPLDSVVTHALVKGHSPGRPVLLWRAPDGGGRERLALFDTEGLFLLACADDFASLRPAANHFVEEHLLVPQASADPSLLAELDAGGFGFITDAVPSRGERWRELRRANAERWYTNSSDARTPALVRSAAELGRAAEEAELLWRALFVERASLAPARDTRLEQSLTLAAALALGTIAWTLWRGREFATPLLAVERFGDLGARVRFTERHVRVRLPLGRRRSDLEAAGLLSDVGGVPWFGGRSVEFTGG
ncbi:MAG TPA: hypothetical protein VN282_19115 [Pyrinomonadaceae bacterium]|nr:hypothetical protein [Pyrinomonadaceae bacterium]